MIINICDDNSTKTGSLKNWKCLLLELQLGPFSMLMLAPVANLINQEIKMGAARNQSFLFKCSKRCSFTGFVVPKTTRTFYVLVTVSGGR